MDEPVFQSAGRRFLPTEHARGPWDRGALHGGAPAALLARAVERFAPAGELAFARLSYEFLRPVPVAPLEVRVEMLRPGGRVQLIGASLHAGDVEVCRLAALRIARVPADPGLAAGPTGLDLPTPDALEVTPFVLGAGPGPSFAATAVEMRFARGVAAAGPVAVWLRLRRPIVDDEEPTPLMRVAAVADFGNGVSAELDFARTTFVNPDLVVHLRRLPAGDWVMLDARTEIEPGAGALALSVLHDERGPFGAAAQALLIRER
ncbi:MAG: thioesterase family protein [Solirubrobacteraceae bacterium]